MLLDSQLPALKSAILAETDPAFVANRQAGNTGLMAEFYNTASTFIVWRSMTPRNEVAAAISYANYTPADTPDGTQLWLNRNAQCQAKILALQTMLLGGDVLLTGKPNIRQGLQDVLQNVPAGASGALIDAGWLGVGKVRLTIQRAALNGEKIFATGTGTQGAPGDLGAFEGQISNDDIVRAINLP